MYKQIIIIIASLIPLQTLATEHPSVLELLDKYAQTQNKLKSFISEETSEWKQDSPRIRAKYKGSLLKKVECKFATDGERVHIRLNVQSNNAGHGGSYWSYLWDGSSSVEYNTRRNEKYPHAIINSEKKNKNRSVAILYDGSPLIGFLGGGIEMEPVVSILRKADTISVRDKMEQAGKAASQCYVIDADTKYGKYKVWIDPNHGYNIAKAKVKKGKRHVGLGVNHSSISFSMENVRFERPNNIWIPMECDFEHIFVYSNGQTGTTKKHLKRINIELNPDFEAADAFMMDIPDGTRVYIRDIDGNYTWQDGQVVDKSGKVIMDCSMKKPAKK